MKLFKPIFPARDFNYNPVYKNTYNTSPVMGQKFGENVVNFYAQLGLKGHNGLDIPCVKGTPIFSSHEGIVIKLSEKPSYGLGVTIQTFDGLFTTIYWHLDKILVKVGQKVRSLDLIGLANSTGMSTGNHLHFGLYPANEPKNNGYDGAINPLPYIIERLDFKFDKYMWLGKSGEDIRNLQIVLAYEGFLGQVGFAGFTGYFGIQTLEAVRMFQKKYGIPSTGFVGKLTIKKLNSI